MGVAEILAQIDFEIAQLQQARALLNASNGSGHGKRAAKSSQTGKKRNLTPEGRRRIAEAVRRRWARERKASAAKTAPSSK